MAKAGNRHLALAVVAAITLVGCEDGQTPYAKPQGDTASSDSAAAPARSARLVDRDVEAPEVFQTTGQGLWDGRPSLGGVWVATPDVTDPERVLIRNTANGKFVIGALFKRERENPGPPIQVSSDAAAALGLLAGQPGEVSVTALRREEAPTAPPAADQPILDAPETVAAETPAPEIRPAAKPLDTAAVAAAIDTADGSADATGLAVAAEPDAAPAKRKWWQRKDKTPAVAATPDAPPEGAPTTASAAAITSAPLAAPAPAAAPTAPASGGKSLIQLGIFSVEENADRAAAMVKKAGSPASVRKETSNGKPYWSVVAGPANSAAEREALMKKVKDMGFADAYFVSR